MPHDHHSHAHPPQDVRPDQQALSPHAHHNQTVLRWSLLRASAGQRLIGTASLLILLWLATRWAVA